jgi:hypothetical protein
VLGRIAVATDRLAWKRTLSASKVGSLVDSSSGAVRAGASEEAGGWTCDFGFGTHEI